jgi:lactate permease
LSVTNSQLWSQSYGISGLGLGLSTLIAAVPVFTLLYLLGVKRKPAWFAGLSGLAVAILIATAAYRMPLAPTFSAAAYGAAFGLFPICWIILWAIVLYRMVVDSGHFEIIKDSVASLTPDSRLQALVIGFGFGAFLEGAAGFGTPVAVAAAMLTGLGFSPWKASAVCMLANTAPVVFGSIGIPVVTLAAITGLPFDRLAAVAGRLSSPVSLFLPAYLILACGGAAALSGILPAALFYGAIFAAVQFVVSNFLNAQLTDIFSSLLSVTALLLFLRFWRHAPSPNISATFAGDAAFPSETVRQESTQAPRSHSTRAIAFAWLPYALLVFFVLLWGIKPIQHILSAGTWTFGWPALHNHVLRTPPVVAVPAPYGAIYNFNTLSASGSACFLATLVSCFFLRLSPARYIAIVISVARQLALPVLTTCSVLAMAFLMNYCGATGTLGLAVARTGVLFPFFGALLGWLGVFLTGSDTSSNALFGSLQVITAHRLKLDPILMAANNSVGGVMGKMISLQTIAVAAAATNMNTADQARLFRFAFKHSLLLAAVIGLIASLYVFLRIV